MRKSVLVKSVSLLVLASGVVGLMARPAAAQPGSGVEFGVDYDYVRANTPAGGCGCFAMNGGAGWVAFNFRSSLGIVGEVAGQHAANIAGTGADLSLTSFLAGPRYTWGRARRFAPFAQALFGGVHASGSLAPGSSGLAGTPNTFALAAGGGVDIDLTRHLALKAFEADYYLTRFDNTVNEHQNNLRIAAGVIVRFGARR